MAGIYIHIPFCKKACHYCDFHFSTTLNLVDDVVNGIVLEAERMQKYLNEPIETIYFGGGTPTILGHGHLEKIITSIYKYFVINDSVEFTMEANPDDLTEDKIRFLASVGVNRLSIGTQSFDDTVLTFLNRSHTANQTKIAVELSKKYGIDNISLDLIYGIPGQSKAQWQQNLQEMISLQPSHISCYALTIEDKTVFGNWVKKGKLNPVVDDLVVKEYEFMVDFLSNQGYDHYEVSNFSKLKKHSQHNSSYWHQNSYLGLGPGAHSFNGKERHFNVSNNPKYLKAITSNSNPFTRETLSKSELLTEYIFTRIRTKWGVDFNLVTELFNYTLSSTHLDYVTMLVSKKLATFVDNKLILNSKGLFVSDAVALELMPEK